MTYIFIEIMTAVLNYAKGRGLKLYSIDTCECITSFDKKCIKYKNAFLKPDSLLDLVSKLQSS